jgi:hypothetical protein
MHIALAVMLAAYVVPMVYLVRLARLEMKSLKVNNDTQRESEHGSQTRNDGDC